METLDAINRDGWAQLRAVRYGFNSHPDTRRLGIARRNAIRLEVAQIGRQVLALLAVADYEANDKPAAAGLRASIGRLLALRVALLAELGACDV